MYIDVILPIAVGKLYSYAVKKECESKICVGGRVAVELGPRKVYSGIVYQIHNEDATMPLKEVFVVLDTVPVVSRQQLNLWKWVAEYYMCSLNEVMRRFFPASMRVDTYTEIVENGFNFTTKYSVRNVDFVSFCNTVVVDTASVRRTEASLVRAKTLKETFEQLCIALHLTQTEDETVRVEERVTVESVLKEGVKREKLRELEKRGIVRIDTISSTIDFSQKADCSNGFSEIPQLTSIQNEALTKLKTNFIHNPTTLLYGVSGAGKTEIYAHRIAETLASGKDALLLIPELALSAQIVKRMEHYFGDHLLIYNSHQTPVVRHHAYNRVLHSTGGHLIVATQTGVGLPFVNLGLIVVDEEHSEAYKSCVTQPRINARDCAVMLAAMHGAQTILVSATPSVESFYNSKTGKYGTVTLSERFIKTEDPKITVIERRLIATDEKRMRGYQPDTRYFSTYLLKRIREEIATGHQVILFQNRRGYSSSVECKECGEVAVCPECNIALTFHKNSNKLMCHYCSYTRPMDSQCDKCGADSFQFWGIGTQNIAEKITEAIPDARVVRIDSDSSKSSRQFAEIISAIENGEADVIVGTSLITKGFDFERVTLVGVINCDTLLGFADFRASERAYSLLLQLGGRTTRSGIRGEMILQTNRTKDSIITDLFAGSYETMYEREIAEREKFLYPPFSRIIEIKVSHKDVAKVDEIAETLSLQLKERFGFRVLGPTIPVIEKHLGYYRRIFHIKIENGASLKRAKALIEQIKNGSISYNVDI